MFILASPIISVLFLVSNSNIKTTQKHYNSPTSILTSSIMTTKDNAIISQLGSSAAPTGNSNTNIKAQQQQPSGATTATPSPTFSDALFTYIERCQREYGKPFNKLLDAGTGTHSLRWIAALMDNSDGLPVDDPLYVQRYTAITADEIMRKAVVKEADQLGMVDKGDIVIGNWFSLKEDDNNKDTVTMSEEELASGNGLSNGSSSTFLADQKFDTILADYLIGALDGFSPYYQDLLLSRLNRHLNPGGRIYIVGLQPIPDHVDDDANIVCKITKVRDACILLAGHRCYREYPVDWVVRHIQKIPQLRVVKISQFPILYSHDTIVRQLNVARSKLPLFPTPGLAKEMETVIQDLEQESYKLTQKSRNGKLKIGFDYVLVIEKAFPDEEELDQEQECGEI